MGAMQSTSPSRVIVETNESKCFCPANPPNVLLVRSLIPQVGVWSYSFTGIVWLGRSRAIDRVLRDRREIDHIGLAGEQSDRLGGDVSSFKFFQCLIGVEVQTQGNHNAIGIAAEIHNQRK